MKYELCGKIVAEFAALRPKSYNYLTDGNHENEKAESASKVCHKKRKLNSNFISKQLNLKIK